MDQLHKQIFFFISSKCSFECYASMSLFMCKSNSKDLIINLF
jgi:hypothetical protein